jgi:hypothetical protein
MPVGCGAAAVNSAKSCRASMVCMIDSGVCLVSRYCAIAMDIGFVRNRRGPLLAWWNNCRAAGRARSGRAGIESRAASLLAGLWPVNQSCVCVVLCAESIGPRPGYRVGQEGAVAMFGVGDVEAGRREILVVETGLGGLLSQAPRTRNSSCKSTSSGPKSAVQSRKVVVSASGLSGWFRCRFCRLSAGSSRDCLTQPPGNMEGGAPFQQIPGDTAGSGKHTVRSVS